MHMYTEILPERTWYLYVLENDINYSIRWYNDIEKDYPLISDSFAEERRVFF